METLINLSSKRYGYRVQEVVLGSVIALGEHLRRHQEADGSFSPLAFAQTIVDLDAALRGLCDDLSEIDLRGAPRWLALANDHSTPLVERVRELLVDVVDTLGNEITSDDWGELDEALNAVALGLSNPAPFAPVPAMVAAPLAARSGDPTRSVTSPPAEFGEHVQVRHAPIDIPICDAAGHAYFLLKAHVTLKSSGRVSVGVSYLEDLERNARVDHLRLCGWKPATDDFVDGVEKGAAAANALLAMIGSPLVSLDNVPVLELRGVVPPWQVMGRSVALPVALEILRQRLQLSPTTIVATGSIRPSNGKWTIEATPADIALAKLRAVRDEGTKTKLALVADQALEGDEFLVLGSGNAEVSLDAAARRIWALEYVSQIQELAAPSLRKLGFKMGWQDPHLEGLNAVDQFFVRSPQADRFVGDLEAAADPTAWIVGGPVRSGKTWMVRDVVERLTSSGRWNAMVLCFADDARTLNISSELEATLEKAASLLDPETKRLLVLEDVPFRDDLLTLDRRLCRLARDHRVHIVLTRRSDNTTDWRPTSCREVDALQSTKALNEFVDALVEQHGDRLATQTPEALRQALETDDKQFSRDIWWITEVARSGRSFHRMREHLFTGVEPATEETLKKIAYASLLGFGLPPGPGAVVPDEIMQRFSVVPNERGQLTIPQRMLAYLVVNGGTHGERIDWINHTEAARYITPIIEHYLNESDGVGVLHVLSALRRESKEMTRLIFGRRERKIPGRLDAKYELKLADVSLVPTPEIAAGLAIRTSELVDERVTVSLLTRMLANLLSDLHSARPRTNCRTLRLCLQAMDAHYSLFATHSGNDATDAGEASPGGLALQQEELKRRLSGPNGQLARILEQEESPQELLWLGESIERDGHKWLCMAFFDCHHVLIERIGGTRQNRFENASRLLEVIEKIALRIAADNIDTSVLLQQTVANVEDFAQRVADDDRSIRTLLDFCEWARLRLRLDRNFSRELVEHYQDTFKGLITTAQIDEVVFGLGRLHDASRHALAQLLNQNLSALAPHRLRWDQATLGQVADLLFAVPKWHRLIAQSLLTSSDSERAPNRLLAKQLATRLRHTRDAKSCGRIIKAAAEIEDLHRDAMRDGFSYRLASEVGLEFFLGRIEAESRHTIVYHLLDGLARIDHHFLIAIAPAVVERIANDVNNGALHEGPPGLAVRLCEGPFTGPMFQEALLAGDRIDVQAVARAMINAIDVEALGAFHRLGSLLPGALEAYKLQVSNAAPVLPLQDQATIKGRPLQSLRAANRIVDTFRRANWIDKAIGIQDAFGFEALTIMLRNARAAGADAALDELRALSPRLALDFLQSQRAPAILNHKLQYCLRDPYDAASLVGSIARIERDCVYRLHAARSIDLGPFRHQTRSLQNPRTFATVCNQMVALELLDPVWVKQPFEDFWLPVLNRIRSPAALTELLLLARRLDELTDDGLLPEALQRLNREGIARRLSAGATRDLPHAGSLLSLAAQGDDIDLALGFSEAIASVDALEQRLPVERWFGLLSALSEVNHVAAARLLPRFDKEATVRTGRSVLFNDVVMWRAIGAYALLRHSLGADPLVLGDAAAQSLSVPKDPTTVLFATEWLEESQWRNDLRNTAVGEIQDRPDRIPLDMWPLTVRLVQRRGHPLGFVQAQNGMGGASNTRFEPFAEAEVERIFDLVSAP